MSRNLCGIILKKDGFYGNYWNGKIRQYSIEKFIEEHELLQHIRYSLTIEEDVLLKDIAAAVHSFRLLEAIVGSYGQALPWIEKLNDILINSDYDYKNDEWLKYFEYLEVYWSANADIHDGEQNLDIGPEFHGMGFKGQNLDEYMTKNMSDEDKKEYRQNYGLTFTPSAHCANIPVKLNKQVIIYSTNYDDQKLKWNEILKCNREFDVLEALSAIYFELTFSGSEENKVARYEEVMEAKEQMQELQEQGKLIPVIEGDKEKGSFDIVMSDQVREFFGMPSNEEAFDEEIRKSAEDDSV